MYKITVLQYFDDKEIEETETKMFTKDVLLVFLFPDHPQLSKFHQTICFNILQL